jgi:hypothetical protein
MLILISFYWACKHQIEMPKPVNFYNAHLDSVKGQYTRLVSPCAILGQYYQSGTAHLYPSFNPKNPYEIVFLQSDSTSAGCNMSVFKFSFITGKKTFLTKRACYSTSWSTTGWILFPGSDRQLWKVKDNGDSLTRLTHNNDFNNHAVWNSNGTLFAYQFGVTIRVCNPNGTLFQEIQEATSEINWLNDSTMIYANYLDIIAYNIKNQKKTILRAPFPGFGMLLWDEKKSYYPLMNGVGRDHYWVRYHYDTQRTDTLKRLYDSYAYIHLTYHPTTQKCLAVLDRRGWRDSAQCDILYQRNLILMNPDGTDEKLIRIPD